MKTNTIKKTICSVALSAALVASVSGGTYNQNIAMAEESCYEATSYQSSLKVDEKRDLVSQSATNQEYNSQTIETFISRAVEEDVESIDFIYNELYSLYNEKYGYVLDFSYSNRDGFVIVSTVEDSEKVIEMDLAHRSPYSGKDGKYIYVSFDRYYIEYDNGRTVRVSTNGEEVDAIPSAGPLKNKGKKGIASPQSYNYATGWQYVNDIPNFNYKYTRDLCSDKKNNCANAAGVIALNYWNSYLDNRILRLSDNQMIDGTCDMNNDTAKKYMYKFYDYMCTNIFFDTYGGTLPGDCHDGFMRVITENGYNARKETVSSYGDIKYYINIGVPVFITSTDYYFTYTYEEDDSMEPLPDLDSTQGDHTLTIDFWRSYGIENSHTFVGFGYAEYTLYDNDGNESKIKLVRIADGWGTQRYFNYSISETWKMAAIRVSRC